MSDIEVITIKQIEEFDRMLLDNPAMKREVNKIISRILSRARTQISRSARGAINDDPRQAYKAVKRAVYKRIIGGNVSILSKKKRSAYTASLPSTSRTRSQRTANLMSYWGADRGFVLRFLNSGTAERAVSSINGRHIGSVKRRRGRQYKSGTLGSRGRIVARGWFDTSAPETMNKAAEDFARWIETEIERIDKEYGDINS